MEKQINPFLTSGYIGPEYFCDRHQETERLLGELSSGNSMVLVSTRRMGKTGLIRHCFGHPEIKTNYYAFFIDIYATKSLADFVFLFGKEIVQALQPLGSRAMQKFWRYVKSLRSCISFDAVGVPTFSLGLGKIETAEHSLDEIFSYLANADKPCLIAIDEFQQIASYPERQTEALLRTHIQRTQNVRFVFSGSRHHLMGQLFLSASRPFYQSASMLHLQPIDLTAYTAFAQYHFCCHKKTIRSDAVTALYHRFDGITWYMQKMLHVLFNTTQEHGVCTVEQIPDAVKAVVDSYDYVYAETLFRLPQKQAKLLVAMAKEERIHAPTSGSFVQKYGLISASSVQAALKILLEKDFVTQEHGVYHIYDRFFADWLRRNY